jgi:hypothetical protein
MATEITPRFSAYIFDATILVNVNVKREVAEIADG